MKSFVRDLRDLALVFGVCLAFTVGIQASVSRFVPSINAYPSGVDDDDDAPARTAPPGSGDGSGAYYNVIQPFDLDPSPAPSPLAP